MSSGLELYERRRSESRAEEYARQLAANQEAATRDLESARAVEAGLAGSPPPAKSQGAPGMWQELEEDLNPLDTGPLERGASSIAKQAGEVEGFLQNPQKAGEELGHTVAAPVEKALGSVTSWTAAIKRIAEDLVNPTDWIRILKVIGGVILLVFMLYLFAKAAGWRTPSQASVARAAGAPV